MALDERRLRSLVVQQLTALIDGLPPEDRRKTMAVVGFESISPQALLEHVRDETDLGNEIFENAVAMLVTDALASGFRSGPQGP